MLRGLVVPSTQIELDQGAGPMGDWLVAVTEWDRPALAGEVLAAQGFNCYQPRYRERRVNSRGFSSFATRYLFGRYILVEKVLDCLSQLACVMYARGVSGMLIANEQPLLALEHEVKALQKREDIEGFVMMPKRVKRGKFLRGDQVRIIEGKLIGFSGVFERSVTNRTVEINLNGLLGGAAVQIRECDIVKAG